MPEEKLNEPDQVVKKPTADPSVESVGPPYGLNVFGGVAAAAFGLAAAWIFSKPSAAVPVVKKVAGSVISAAMKR